MFFYDFKKHGTDRYMNHPNEIVCMIKPINYTSTTN